MFNCNDFLFTCSQAFTCSASFTCNEAYLCNTPYTLSLPYTVNESFTCATPYTLSESFACVQPFECLHDYECTYWDPYPRLKGRYHVHAQAIIHSFAHWFTPPRRVYSLTANVLSSIDVDRIIYVGRDAVGISLIHGGTVSHIEKGKLYSIGAHIIAKDSVTSEIVARRNVDAKTVVHAGLVYKTPVVHTFSIGGHIISLPAVTKGVYAFRSTDATVILHSGVWYSIETAVPFKIGSHMMTVTSSDKVVDVKKGGAGIAVLHHGIVFDKDEVTFMYRTVYKDVGLASLENIAMQNIENNTVYLALFSSGVEVSGNGYARASIGFGSIYATAGEKVDSNTDATFPMATAQWDDIDEVRIFSASTGGTQYIAMTIATFDVPLNYVLQFNSGDVEVEAT